VRKRIIIFTIIFTLILGTLIGIRFFSNSSESELANIYDQPDIPTPNITNSSEFLSTSECKLERVGNNSDIYTGFSVVNKTSATYGTIKTISSIGEHKAIVIFVDFIDLAAEPRAITEWKNTQIPYAERAFSVMSYGKYKLTYEIKDKFYHLPTKYGSYIKKEIINHSLSKPKHGLESNKLLKSAILAANGDVDFSKYDFVNVVTPIFDPPADGGAVQANGFNADGKTSFPATLGPIDPYLDDPTQKNWLLHETGHLLGLTHIYNYEGGMAGWDVMGNVFGNDDLIGWNKFFLGWVDDNQVNCIDPNSNSESIHLLTPIGTSSIGTKIAMVKISKSKAILVEVRRKTELDNLSDYSSGVIVYELDISIPANKGTIRIVSNPYKYGQDTTKGDVLLGTMPVGKFTTTNGYTVTVLKNTQEGDYVSIKKSA
jgi:M6 family metalloprotease-like protein